MPQGRMLPEGRGLDWSLAGYREGRVPIPFLPVRYNVKAFGAKGDGSTDDTAAIHRAVAAANASPGVILFPEGVYILRKPFTVYRSKVVLRGVGQGATTIHIPDSLSEVFPGTFTEEGGVVQSAWNSGGGFINFAGRRQRSDDGGTLLAYIEDPVGVGSNRIPVRNTARLRVGQRIRIYVNDKSTADSGADNRRRRLASEGLSPLPVGLRFLNTTAPSWVLDDPVVQAALENARLLRAGDTDEHEHDAEDRSSGVEEPDFEQPFATAVADLGVANFGAPAPTPGGPLGGEGDSSWEATGDTPDSPGPASAPAAAPSASRAGEARLRMYTRAAGVNGSQIVRAPPLVDEDGADVGTVAAWLYGDNLVDSGEYKSGVVDKDEVVMTARVTAVGPDFITIDRGMPFPVKTEVGWVGMVHLERPSVEDSGIERMTVRFKHTQVGPHHTDKGYNAIQVSNAANFWIRNVTILNADTPIYYSYTHRSVIKDVTLSVTTSRASAANHLHGHHGVCITEGQMNLVSGLSVAAPFIHDITISSSSSMNVVMDSAGFNLNLDHHRTAPFANLFTNLNMGHGTRPFASGGRGDRGAHAGRGNTYWFLRSASGRPLYLPGCDFGPILNFVGPYNGFPCPGKGWMVRPLYQMPPNLYRAQRWKFGRA